MDDLRRRLEELADRGEPRGADAVLAAARARAGARRAASRRRPQAALAIAASVALVSGVAVAAVRQGAGRGPGGAAPPLATRPARPAPAGSTTSTTPPTTAPGARSAPPAREVAAARLRPFASCNGLLSTIRAKALEVVGPYGLPGTGGRVVGSDVAIAADGTAAQAPAAAGSAERATGAGERGDAGGPQFSTTNVQEAGVDEPDTLKTDGRTIFAVARGALWAVGAGPDPKVVARIPLEQLAGRPVGAAELLLTGDRLVVLTGTADVMPLQGDVQPAPRAPAPREYRPQSMAVVLDVGQPSTMRVVARLEVDGTYLSAREVGGVVRIVLRSSPRGLAFTYPTDFSPEAKARATSRNRQVIAASTLDNWLPTVSVVDGAGRVRSGPAACGAAYQPPDFAGFGTITVLTLDPKDPTNPSKTTVVADGDVVYGSRSRLYVATTAWARVEGDVVVPASQTQIHAFDTSGPGAARYRVSGTVRGTILNQFSMSEHEGLLRVATTDPTDVSESFVTVLADNGAALVPVGQVGGLGRGERIHAVRFIGPVGYVVTFRQVDPLYVVDLRDPAHPRVAGELKIEGYSAYLHPAGDNLLLGVGQDADEQGRRLGTQVSLFDVSDPANPRRLQRMVLGPGESPVEFDHHAFLWWPATRLALVPYSQFDPAGARPPFSGAAGLTVEPSGIRLVRRVAHPASAEWGGSAPITRSAVVGGLVFTLSDAGLLASDLTTLADRAWVPLGN